MFCKNCGAEMNAEQAVCTSCGVPTGKGNKFCPNCGKETAAEAVVCVNCGVSLGNKATAGNGQYLNGKDKIVMAVIAFFLGGIGIHNFMMGETKKGIFKIVMSFLCGIGAILALIDLIKIAMGTYEVNPDKLI